MTDVRVRRSTGPFWIRSVRRRPVAVVVLAALAALATAASVLAPLLLRAVEQTALSESLATGGLRHTAVTASADIQPSRLAEAQDAVLSVTNSIEHGRLWQQEVVVAETRASATWTPHGSSGAERTGGESPIGGVGDDCRRLTLVSGTCPSGIDEVLLLGIPVAAVALLLTVLAVLAVGLVGAATRSTELAALRSAGVDGRRTRRALVLGAFLPTAGGTVLGAVAGTLATLLVADRLPLRDGVAPPVGLLVGPWPVVATVVGGALLLLVAAVVTARAEQRAGGSS